MRFYIVRGNLCQAPHPANRHKTYGLAYGRLGQPLDCQGIHDDR